MKTILMLLAVAVLAGACEGRTTVVETKEVTKCFCNDQEIVCGNTCAPEVVTVTECRCNGEQVDCDAVCEPETVTVTECRCNGEQVACDAACEPETVTNTVCRCNGEPSACDATCEPVTVTETVYVCEIDGREVADPADCPAQVLVCEEDQIPFQNTTTGEIGCVNTNDCMSFLDRSNDGTFMSWCTFPQDSTDTVSEGLIQSVTGGPIHDTVYYLQSGTRYVFTYSEVFDSWYANDCLACASSRRLSQEQMATIPLAGNVTLRPGSAIKIGSDPRVYLVDECRVARWLTTEQVQLDVYGGHLPNVLEVVPDVFFTNYFIGPDITDTSSVNLTDLLNRTLPEELDCAVPADPGTLTLSVDGSTPRSTIVLSRSEDVQSAVFKVEAEAVNKHVVSVELINCVEMGADGICLENGNDDAVRNITLSWTQSSGTMSMSVFRFIDGRAMIEGLYIPVIVGNPTRITVKADANTVGMPGTVGETAVPSGARYGITMAIRAFAGPATTVMSQCGSGGCSGNPMTLRKTKPTISLAAGSPSGAGVPGWQEVLRINVSCDSRGPCSFLDFPFKVVTVDGAGTGWNECNGNAEVPPVQVVGRFMLKENGSNVPIAGWGYGSDQDDECNGDAILTGATAYFQALEVGAGQTRTFSLHMNTTGASAEFDDAVRVDMVNLVWNDGTGVPAINGDLVKNLPVIGGTIVY